MIRCRIIVLVFILCFVVQTLYASDLLKIVPDSIDFGFIPLDREVIKEITLKNITDNQISNVSISIPDTLLSYYRSKFVSTSIEPFDTTTITLSSCCHEMFVSCDGKISIHYTCNDSLYSKEVEVKGTPALTRGWNWISFPRVNRKSKRGHELSEILKPLQPYARTVLCKGGVMENIEHTWAHMDLYHYDDTSFIKLLMLGGDEPVYPFEQNEDSLSLLPADTSFDLQKGYNWIGYRLPHSQNLEQAFGEYWNKVHAIKAENWLYLNEEFLTEDYQILFDIPAHQTRSLNYGRGYVMIMEEPIKNFRWNVGNDAERYEQLCSKGAYFNYETKAHYEVVDVINIPEGVEEVGAFIENDVCIGSGFVDEHLSAQLLLYPTDYYDTSQEIILRLKYHGKSETRNAHYVMHDISTRKFVDKKLTLNTQLYNIIKIRDE